MGKGRKNRESKEEGGAARAEDLQGKGDVCWEKAEKASRAESNNPSSHNYLCINLWNRTCGCRTSPDHANAE